jgi:hypothetical protein
MGGVALNLRLTETNALVFAREIGERSLHKISRELKGGHFIV